MTGRGTERNLQEAARLIHYKTFETAIRRARDMPEDVLRLVMTKPASTDRASDAAWRRMCRRWHITTSHAGISESRQTYDHVRYLEKSLESLRRELRSLGRQLRECHDLLSKMKALDVVRRFHPRG